MNKINYERYSEIYFRPLINFCYMYIDNNNLMFDNLYLNIMEKYESMGDIPKAVYIVHKSTKDKDFIVGHKTKDLKFSCPDNILEAYKKEYLKGFDN